jgi:hypothetical protein
MPHVVIEPTPTLQRALDQYMAEVREVETAIAASAKFAGEKAAVFLPPELKDEIGRLDAAFRVMDLFRGDVYQLIGDEVSEKILSVIHSALLLRRDDLLSQVELLAADRLTPSEALVPLRFKAAEIEDDVQQRWAQYGVSPYLDVIRQRRTLKRGLEYPKPQPTDLLIAQGEGQHIEFMVKFPTKPMSWRRRLPPLAPAIPALSCSA